jgi:hypothetical protein
MVLRAQIRQTSTVDIISELNVGADMAKPSSGNTSHVSMHTGNYQQTCMLPSAAADRPPVMSHAINQAICSL